MSLNRILFSWWKVSRSSVKVIVIMMLLYIVLAPGGYLDSFGSFGNFSSGLFNFNFQDADVTTPSSVPTPFIALKPKNVARVHNKINAKRIPHMRHFIKGYLQTQNPKRIGQFKGRTPPRSYKTQLATKARKSSSTKTRSTTIKTPLTTRSLSTTRSHLTSTDGTLFMDILTENYVSSKIQKRKVNQTTAIGEPTDIPLQSTYVTKYIEKCPEEGYFFKRDFQGAHSDTCYLCFCESNSSAICWQRNNKKCDAESYQHNWPKKRVSRNRRSISFGDLFMQDATKTVFNAQTQKTCKPNEASYSEGCPPLDWCVGCTVCDCNNNGKWDCHLLSFCTDDNKKNKNKNKNYKGELQGHFYDPFAKPKTQRAEREKSQRAVQNLAEKMAQERQKKKIGKSDRRRYFFKNGTLVNKTIFDLRKRKKSPTILNQSSAEVQRWSNLNMKIRKIPDQITRQKLFDKQQSNARKVSESANFIVRKMPNKKTKQMIEQKHSQAFNVLAKRQPNRKKKRQVILPSGLKLPKELLDKLPPGVIPPTRDPPGDHFPKKSHVKRVLPNQMAATKPPRQTKIKRSLELSSEVTDKKMVKRSTKFDNVSKKRTKRKENIAHRRKVAKSSSNIFKKKMTGLKENAKKRSVMNTNSKMPMKSHSKSNHYASNKNNDLKTAKNPTKSKEKNKLKNKSGDLKNKNNMKNNPKNLRKSLKRNGNKNQKHHSNHKNALSKKISNNNEDQKKSILNKSSVKVKKDNNNRRINNNTSKKSNDFTKDKVKTTKKLINKHTNKAKKNVLNKNSVKRNHIRGKRSDSPPWVKTVTEGNKVIKFAPLSAKKSNNQNSPKKRKQSSPKENMELIKRKKLNEEVKKLAGNIQTNLNRKVLEAVGLMLGKNLTQQSKKVKRSVDLEMVTVNENESKEQSLDMIDVAEGKQSLSLPFLEYSGQRIKRSPNNDEIYNESRHIPFIVKKRPLPPVKHIQKREVLINQLHEHFQTRKAVKELNKYLESAMMSTPIYLTTNIKRSVSLSKSEKTADSDLIDIHVPIRKLSRNIVNYDSETTISVPTKQDKLGVESEKVEKLSMVVDLKPNERRAKSQSFNVDKLIPVQVNRHKRSADIEQSATTHIQPFENEISTNSLQGIHNITTTTIKNNIEATDLISKYYKYTVDDYLDIHTAPAVKNYVTEVVEVYTKNVAAKRSVDKHIELPNINVDQLPYSDLANKTVPVQGLTNNDKDSTIMISQLLENKMVSDDDDKLKVHAAKPPSFSPTDVLDNKVVIIQNQNVSSIEHLSELTTNSRPSPTVTTDSDPRLINETVLGIKSQENQLPKNIISDGEFNVINTNENIDKSSSIVDKSVVIIHDLNRTIMPKTGSHLSVSTQYNTDSKTDASTNMYVTKEPLSIVTTKTNEKSSSKIKSIKLLPQPLTSTSVKVSEKPSIENKNLSTDDFPDDYLFVRKNDFKPQMAIKNLHGDRNQYLVQLTTKTDINTKYAIDNNVTKKDMSLIDIGLKESEVIPDTIITTTEQIKINTFKPIIKNYLKYDIDTKIDDMKQNFAKQKNHKKVKKLMHQENKAINLTEKSRPKHLIDDYVVIVVQKDPYPKTKENHSEANGDSLTTDKKNKNFDNLPLKESNTIDQENSITNSTSKFTKQVLTTQISESTEILPLLQDQIQKNVSKSISEIRKVKTYDIKKFSVKKAKKHKLKKMLSTLHNKTNKDERYLINYIVKNKKNLTINKSNDLKSFFKKLLSNFKFNKHARKPSNVKRFKILKYLQKFFKKIFSDDEKNKRNKTFVHQLNRKNVIETLCSSFGPCNINVKNKAKLQSQIDHLNSETYKMLRSVKIIKGLLKLVDMAKNDKKVYNGTNLKYNFKSDVQKLHAILRDTYSNSNQMDTLSDTQKIQIQYIKNSTQNFIQSAAKFTMVLNEIINIITLHNHKNTEEESYRPTNERKEKLNTKKIFKSRNINSTATVTKSTESLQKLKELISKYSLIQNTFMRKIYNVLTNLDSKEGKQKKNRATDATIATKHQQHQNKTEEIQVYTKNIIQNLRKLKNLAQNLNGDMGHVRRKRDLRNDDSLEYMLMLMEYILKQQHPLDDAPVNDGIDLLIEAIKSAPNIKAIKKKVLPAYINYSTKYPTKPTKYPTKMVFKARNNSKSSESLETKQPQDVSSESDSKPSKEENVTSSNLEEPKFNIIDQSLDDDAEDQDYYVYNRRAHLPSTVQITSTQSHTKSIWHEEATTDVFFNTISDLDVSTKSKSRGNTNDHAMKVTKFDFFNRFENVPSSTTVSKVDYTPEITAIESSTKIDMITNPSEITPLVQMRRYNNDNVGGSKFRIDWLDETYEEEIKDYQKTSPAPVKAIKHTQLYPVKNDADNLNTTKQPKKSEDVSGLSREDEKETKKSTTTKDILYKKEMGLLNSLDYGTEKTEIDASASRESGAIDKYSGDTFSTYFREERI